MVIFYSYVKLPEGKNQHISTPRLEIMFHLRLNLEKPNITRNTFRPLLGLQGPNNEPCVSGVVLRPEFHPSKWVRLHLQGYVQVRKPPSAELSNNASIHLYPSLSISIHLYPSLSRLYPSLSISVYPCLSMSVHVYPCLSISIDLYPSLSHCFVCIYLPPFLMVNSVNI